MGTINTARRLGMGVPCKPLSPTRYVESISSDQLLGTLTTDVSDDCTPLYENGSLTLHPCGLIANTLFNDIFTVNTGQTMDETDIAWDSDVSDKVWPCFVDGVDFFLEHYHVQARTK